MKRQDLMQKYRGIPLFAWIQLGCGFVWALPLCFLPATGWHMPVDTVSRHHCNEVLIAYLGILVLIHVGLKLLAGPDPSDIGHDWKSGETVISGSSLREWGLIGIPCLIGFFLALWMQNGRGLSPPVLHCSKGIPD